MRHAHAFPEQSGESVPLAAGGQYQWRTDGEYHLFNPETIHQLQKAVRTGSYATFKSYAELINDQSKQLCTLRGLLDFKAGDAVPIEEVESVEALDEALQDRRHVLRLDQQGSARNAGHRDEPHRRQEQHRRRRRRSGALQADGQRRFEEFRHQAGGLRALRRDQRIPGAARRNCRSRWRRARSPAKAASCRAARCIRGSPRCATPPRASA